MVSDRTSSESSDDFEIRPLELVDLKRGLIESSDEDEVYHCPHNAGSNRFFSAVYGMGRKRQKPQEKQTKLMAKLAWRNAVIKAKAMGDPWEKFGLEEHKMEKALRHRYNSLKQCWVEDEVFVKMDDIPFNNGAMRECFRLKKLSNFCPNPDWSKAHNYVAKRYIDRTVPQITYYDDVRLQMDAKLWAEEFNRHNPPKKIDIFQMCILEFTERENKPLYHLEHFIEGTYVKYNSNSGYVRSKEMRMTPQAFSHFTFERSGHELIVVDIQGVGDLYTDPQIHTANGNDYGDGNLGTRGMALFFHSHICNSICKSLDLSEFDLAPSELEGKEEQQVKLANSVTMVRGTEEKVSLPSLEERENIQDYIRLRSLSSGYLSNEEQELIDSICKIGYPDAKSDSEVSTDQSRSPLGEPEPRPAVRRARFESMSDSNDTARENDLLEFKERVRKKSRPSHVMGELEHQALNEKIRKSTLGQIHLDIAKYHELNRFVAESQDYDKEAAVFHVEQAALCGTFDAITCIARMHLQLQHDILPDVELLDDKRDVGKGFQYLKMAAELGDRGSMLRLAKMYDDGIGLPPNVTIDWGKAILWYESVINQESSDDDGNYDGTTDDPNYIIIARKAHMFWKGGHNLEKDPDKAGELFSWAAELATEAMKGKLASKYYMLSEEAYADAESECE